MTLKLPAFFLFFLFAHGLQAQCVTWFGGQQSTVEDLSTNDPELWNGAPLFDPRTGSNDLAEAFVGTNITLTDTCQTPLPLRFKLWLDLNGDGTTETLVDSDNPMPPGYVLMNGDTVQFDQRPQPFYAYFRFVLDTIRSGDTLVAKLVWTEDDNPGAPQFNVQLPYGKHRLVWTYGVESFEKSLEIRDGEAPELMCKTTLQVSLSSSVNDVKIFAIDFLDAWSDNYTDQSDVQISVRRAGRGSGFPESVYGNPVGYVSFACHELGGYDIEVWAKDAFGNTSMCNVLLILTDNAGICDFWGYRVHLHTEKRCGSGLVFPLSVGVKGDGLPAGSPPVPPTFFEVRNADTLGGFSLYYPSVYSNYQFSFFDNYLDNSGLSTYDLIRMLRHVQGNQAFTEPHQFVAADANNDRQISDEDVEALHALLTGAIDTLPGQQRWQYLPDDFVFPPGDPLTNGIPDTFPLPEVPAINLRFFAIQTGDVDCTEPPNTGPAFPITATNRALFAGETAAVTVYAGEAETWLGLQTSVTFHPSVELLNVFGSAALPLQANNIQEISGNVLNISWFSTTAQSIPDSAALFTLVFKTSGAMQLSEAMLLSDVRLAPEVYPQAGGKRPLNLTWSAAADTEPPVVACPAQPLNTTIMPATFFATLVVADSLFAASDNLTPDSLLERAIRRVGTGAGFPLDNNGEPVELVSFFCDDVFFNPHPVECWVRDADGNAAFCLREVWVIDPAEVCDPPTLPFSACVTTACGDEPLDSVQYTLQEHGVVSPAVLDTVTGADGCYQSPILQPGLVSDSVMLQARKNTGHLNGVSTFDLVLMLKHILDLETFTEPYQFLAADANNSNTVTTFDIAELRKLILGIYDSLPNNDAWRLYPANYAFPSPNPLAGGVPNSYTVDLAPGAYQLAYKAVKVGDVNCSALADGFLETNDRTVFPLFFPEQTLNAGEILKLPIFAGQTIQWDGFQLALELRPGLTLETVSGGVYTTISEENWHLTEQNVLNLSWITGEAASIPAGAPLFYLHLRAAQKIHTAEAVLLKKGALQAEAYTALGSVQTLELYPSTGKNEVALLSPPQPNPTTGEAIIRLQLPQNETITMELFTTDGRTVYLRTAMLGKGAHDVIIPAEAMYQPGLYLWRLQAGNEHWTGKIQKF